MRPLVLLPPVVTGLDREAGPPGHGPRHAAITERMLVARLRHGDDAAFETLVRNYGPQMLAVARRYFSAPSDAEDVLQSAFVLVFRFIHSFEGTSRLATWLHRIVVNSSLMLLRSRRRHPERSVGASVGEEHHATEVSAHLGRSALEELVERESRAGLLRAVACLPAGVRAAVRLRDLDGLTLDETSLVLGRSVTCVKTDLRRGRSALRGMLVSAPGLPGAAAAHHPMPARDVDRQAARRTHRTMLSGRTTHLLRIDRPDATSSASNFPGDS